MPKCSILPVQAQPGYQLQIRCAIFGACQRQQARNIRWIILAITIKRNDPGGARGAHAR
ncbi:MAG TPA: hypothetical protein VHJ19_08570 [Gammaproteobacteria bacterium]|nr:hypothetical protein [Gammaproteobacteria bacterium]